MHSVLSIDGFGRYEDKDKHGCCHHFLERYIPRWLVPAYRVLNRQFDVVDRSNHLSTVDNWDSEGCMSIKIITPGIYPVDNNSGRQSLGP